MIANRSAELHFRALAWLRGADELLGLDFPLAALRPPGFEVLFLGHEAHAVHGQPERVLDPPWLSRDAAVDENVAAGDEHSLAGQAHHALDEVLFLSLQLTRAAVLALSQILPFHVLVQAAAVLTDHVAAGVDKDHDVPSLGLGEAIDELPDQDSVALPQPGIERLDVLQAIWASCHVILVIELELVSAVAALDGPVLAQERWGH